MDKDIINILEKLFISQQSLTSEEQRIFDEWMKEAGNRQKLYEWQRLESAIYALGTSRKANSEKGWEKINKRIRPALIALCRCGDSGSLSRHSDPFTYIADSDIPTPFLS